jgi:hypothetical protein
MGCKQLNIGLVMVNSRRNPGRADAGTGVRDVADTLGEVWTASRCMCLYAQSSPVTRAHKCVMLTMRW